MYNNNHHIYVLTDILVLIFPINFIKQKENASYKDYDIFFYIDF